MYEIEVKNLTRVYKSSKGIIKKTSIEKEALKGISLNVGKGECFGILGPNGAGKTTLIKILSTLLTPTSGEALVFGRNVVGYEKAIRKRINIVFGGERSLYWRLSARQNLVYFASLYNMGKKESDERIEKLLELVDLTEVADQRVETYSKGMKQRLQIIRGLINDPDIIFLDEPTIGLDPLASIKLRNIICDLKKKEKTIILTTHYMAEADELCDRIMIINKGKIIKEGTSSEIKKSLPRKNVLRIFLDRTDKNIDTLTRNNIEFISNEDELELKHICSGDGIRYLNEVNNIVGETAILNFSLSKITLEEAYLEIVGGS